VQRDGRLLQPVELQVPRGEPAQRPVGDQVVAPPGQAAEQRGRAQREDVAAAQPAPEGGQVVRGGRGGGPGGEERGVQGAGRGADEQVRRDAALVQGVHHPGLHGA